MSPTLLRVGSLRVVMYPRDHDPAHVHVIGPDAEAKFELDGLACVSVRGFSRADVGRIRRFLREHLELLREAWNEWQE